MRSRLPRCHATTSFEVLSSAIKVHASPSEKICSQRSPARFRMFNRVRLSTSQNEQFRARCYLRLGNEGSSLPSQREGVHLRRMPSAVAPRSAFRTTGNCSVELGSYRRTQLLSSCDKSSQISLRRTVKSRILRLSDLCGFGCAVLNPVGVGALAIPLIWNPPAGFEPATDASEALLYPLSYGGKEDEASSSSLATSGCWPFVFIGRSHFKDFPKMGSSVNGCLSFRIS